MIAYNHRNTPLHEIIVWGAYLSKRRVYILLTTQTALLYTLHVLHNGCCVTAKTPPLYIIHRRSRGRGSSTSELHVTRNIFCHAETSQDVRILKKHNIMNASRPPSAHPPVRGEMLYVYHAAVWGVVMVYSLENKHNISFCGPPIILLFVY